MTEKDIYFSAKRIVWRKLHLFQTHFVYVYAFLEHDYKTFLCPTFYKSVCLMPIINPSNVTFYPKVHWYSNTTQAKRYERRIEADMSSKCNGS